ncbi:MAG: hypothetical protein IH595_03635 [Bacteroidales bacterium]|nr:hypothetical protein [Bacteroidales bacterium]
MVEESGGLIREQPQRWDYETRFREYALLLGRKGKDGLESINKYPEKIELNSVWHQALDRMRGETKGDGHERYGLISYDENAREFCFPEISTKGEPDSVPVQVISDEVERAKDELKITSVVGEIHTHPIERPFSDNDLLRLLDDLGKPSLLMSGLTTDKLNIFAFRTRETIPINKFSNVTKEYLRFFETYWRKRAGFKLSKDSSEIVGESLFSNMWKMNFGIAEKHHLALYKGKPKEDLVRIHTDKPQMWIWSDLLGEVLKG